MNKKFEIVEHRFFSIHDPYDLQFTDNGLPWSRVYEYPWILQKMEELLQNPSKGTIDFHNSCWGWTGCHLSFRKILDQKWSGIHSDILLPNPKSLVSRIQSYNQHPTLIQDLSAKFPKWMHQAFTITLNVSVLEEMAPAILKKAIANLYKQTATGGHLLITYDHPMPSTVLLQNWFGRPDELPSEQILTGRNSAVPNKDNEDMNCVKLCLRKIGD